MVVITNIFLTVNPCSKNLNTDITLSNCLFGFVKLTKNADPSKHENNGYNIGFDSSLEFLFKDGKNVNILWS